MSVSGSARLTKLLKLVARAVIAAGAFVIAGLVIGGSEPTRAGLSMAATFAVITLVFAVLLGTERSSWRFTSLGDLQRLLRASVLSVLSFLLLEFAVHRALDLPRSVLVFGSLLDFLLISAAHVLRRVIYEGRNPLSIFAEKQSSLGVTELLLVGDVANAEGYLRALSRGAGQSKRVIGIVSDSARDVGIEIRGVRVLGIAHDLEATVHECADRGRKADALLFVDDGAASAYGGAAMRLKAAGYRLLRLPSLREVDETTAETDVREISVEELLARQPIRLDHKLVRELVTGKRLLITGAGGSIGSEICRQVAAFGCSHLTMLDQSEPALFTIDRDVSARHARLSHRAVLCDVRDKERLTAWMEREKPDIVFHAAALKHVHLVEEHPEEGVLTNVFGTRNVVQAAAISGAKQVVLISTDKAVEPSCIMGATKRIAETIIRSQSGQSGPRFSVVRFGNVLGSAGSVVPIFKDQIQRGGPVTVTHPDVERYFMTIPEAVELVLHATAQSAAKTDRTSEIFVLDMGAPVKIVDLATRLIELSGKVPGSEIAIEFIGLKPGEKMTEQLVDSTEIARDVAAGVFEVVDRKPGRPLSAAQLSRLEEVARRGTRSEVSAEVYKVLGSIRSPELIEA